ncbi:DUF6213 family protein [Streptomyces sp. NPDC001809]
MNALIPLVSASDDRLLVPAERVTGLLRGVAAGWLGAAERGESDLDPRTTLSLARSLSDLADQIDVECIAFMPARDEEDAPEEE